MTRSVADVAARVAARLPVAVVRDMAVAAGRGDAVLRGYAAAAGSAGIRYACSEVLQVRSADVADWATVEAALLAAAAVAEAGQAVTLETVWTGPASDETGHRLTSAVMLDLVASAHDSVLLVSYATHDWPPVVEALTAARRRGVHVVLLLERQQDNPAFSQVKQPLADLDATRLAWPAHQRPAGPAALHAKVLVVDQAVAFVGSANLTDSAMDRNLECGVVIRGGSEPRRLWEHVMSLRDREVLVPVGGRKR